MLIFAVFSDQRTFVFKDASIAPLPFEVFLTNPQVEGAHGKLFHTESTIFLFHTENTESTDSFSTTDGTKNTKDCLDEPLPLERVAWEILDESS